MIRFLKYILLYPVLILIVLHTFIPHAFSNALTADNHLNIHKDNKNILGLFDLIFHEKHDKNLHDLNTRPSKYKIVSIEVNHQVLLICVQVVSNSHINLPYCSTFSDPPELKNELLIAHRNGKRGPPFA